uniref:Uncharacterized protein n=1 Tax=Arundo donax TaxID=35708 RepID=A0A0A9FH14_ARUDO
MNNACFKLHKYCTRMSITSFAKNEGENTTDIDTDDIGISAASKFGEAFYASAIKTAQFKTSVVHILRTYVQNVPILNIR